VRRRHDWTGVLVAGLLPGLLAGTQVAGLLFFLNPGLPFSFAPVARAILVYGSLLGAVSLALSLPWTWGRPLHAWRMLPWGLALALALAALLDGSQASVYAFFLPSGINDRLVKAALWLSLAALICFYTALLHSLSRRRYGLRSRLGLSLVSLLSVYVMVERREAFRPRPPTPARPPVVLTGERPRLWVLGFDGATLDAILPLAGQGRLPFLDTVIRKGAHGRLQSLTPHRPEALWTTLATGKYPYDHGTVGGGIYHASFLEPGAELHLLPVGVAFRHWGLLGSPRSPSAEARTASTLWEILPRLGLRAGVVGWPSSSPVPASDAFALSDRFFAGDRGPGSVQPPQLGDRVRAMRVGPRQIPRDLLSRFGPAGSDALRKALAEDLWRESAARSLVVSTSDLDAFFLVLPGLERVSREDFGGFSAAQFDNARSHVYTDAAEVVASYYVHLDEALDQLARSAPPRGPQLVAIVSAYGFEGPGGIWGKLRTEFSRGASLGGTADRSPDGVLILFGDGIAPGALLTGARLVDLVPTLLYGLGVPIARDADGQVLTSAFDRGFLARHPLTFVPSYEGIAPVRPSASRRSG
jgi:Type I phosphodiesterase / nucleotide pyrophosphatase